jgi:hypothetical protein
VDDVDIPFLSVQLPDHIRDRIAAAAAARRESIEDIVVRLVEGFLAAGSIRRGQAA